MGWKLATAAYEAALGDVLTPRARIALDHICRSSLDAPKGDMPAAEYWGGYASLGACLVGIEGAGSQTGNKTAQRALKELVDHGLIRQTRNGAPGQTARYKILIEGWQRADEQDQLPVDNSDDMGTIHTLKPRERRTPTSYRRRTPVSRT